jgi:hypothetical protein
VFKVRNNGTVEIFHHGRRASALRSKDAANFLAQAETESSDEIQQLLARLTGNYKRGNERSARGHPRNR